MKRSVRGFAGFLTLVLVTLGAAAIAAAKTPPKKVFTTDFHLESCTFADTGRNRFFVLVPGFRQVLKGVEDKAQVEQQITVLGDTQVVSIPGIGDVTTRVVEERESEDGDLAEVSRNFFAICEQTNDVFYFGEDVDIYEDGQMVSHGGAWRAGVDGALPGLAMPGTFLVGSRYFQEVAPGVAMDRAENVAMGLDVDVPAGHFTGAVRVQESSPLEQGKEYKIYAPGVGVVVDEKLELEEVFDPGT